MKSRSSQNKTKNVKSIREISLVFNPYSGKYVIPYNLIKDIVFVLPNGLKSSGISFVMTQSSNSGVSVGVTEDNKIPKMESAEDLGKLNFAASVLKNSFDSTKKENSVDEILKVLAKYPSQEVDKLMHPGFRRNFVTVSRWQTNLNKNENILKENINSEVASKEAKNVLTDYIKAIRTIIDNDLLVLCGKQGVPTLPEISGIPRSVVIELTDRVIQIPIGNSLVNFFYSKNKSGTSCTIKEITDNKVIEGLGGIISKYAQVQSLIIKKLVDEVKVEDEKELLLKTKVTLLPNSIEGILSAPINQVRKFDANSSVSLAIDKVNSVLRIVEQNNFKTALLIKELFGKDYRTELLKNPRTAFLSDIVKDKIKITEEQTLTETALGKSYAKEIGKKIFDVIKEYGLDSKDFGTKDEFLEELSNLSIKRNLELPKPRSLINDKLNRNLSDLMVLPSIKEYLLKSRIKKVRKRTIGYANSKEIGPFLKAMTRSKYFKEYYADISEFLYSFNSVLLQERAISILSSEMRRIQDGLTISEKDGKTFDYEPETAEENTQDTDPDESEISKFGFQ